MISLAFLSVAQPEKANKAARERVKANFNILEFLEIWSPY
jgi:hypothetical protein